MVIACKEGNFKRVKEVVLSDDKIDINYKVNGIHPLDWACYKDKLEIVKFLINQDKYKININFQTGGGNTAIMKSTYCGNIKIAKFLLYQNRYYINLNVKNNSGYNALEISEIHNNIKFVKMIEYFISFRKEFHILLLIFYRKEILPNKMIDMIIKIRKLIEINL